MPKRMMWKYKKHINDGAWKEADLVGCLSENMIDHIITDIKPETGGLNDKAWWTCNANGAFTVQSAYHLLRNKKGKIPWYGLVWKNNLPHKIAFLLWRVLKRRIPTDDILRRMKIPIASRCWCCDNGMEETLDHLFLTAPLAIKLWTQFVSCAGFQISGSSLIATITQCGSYAEGLRGKKILRAVPALILWELKYRYNKRHDKFASYGSMVKRCYKNIQLLIKVTYPQLKIVQCSGQVENAYVVVLE